MNKKIALYIISIFIILCIPLLVINNIQNDYNIDSNEGIKAKNGSGSVYWVWAGVNGNGTSEGSPAGNITYILNSYDLNNAIIKVKSGIYDGIIEDFPLLINDWENMTLESVSGASSTLINVSETLKNGIEIKNDSIIIKGFTISYAKDTPKNGIYIEAARGAEITDNIIIYNYDGIQIYSSSNNIIKGNKILNNSHYGITVPSKPIRSENNTFIENEIKYNGIITKGADGVGLVDSKNNTFYNNTITYNYYNGLFIDGSNLTHIEFNDISYNYQASGVFLFDSFNNKLTRNNISGHGTGDYGIAIDGNSKYNMVYKNNFNNSDNVDSVSDNYFNNSMVGNYWNDYTGSDSDGDGIGEDPYLIVGSIYDYLPAVDPINISDIEPPTLNSTDPSNGTILCPNFTFKYDYLNDKINHYRLRIDGGIWNYTNQTSWIYSEIANGTHILEILAIDNGWNIASDEISFIVDDSPLSVNIISPTDHTGYKTSSIYINITVDGIISPITEVKAEIVGQNINISLSNNIGNLYYNLTTFNDGLYTIKIYVYDECGSVNDTQTIIFIVDTATTLNIPGYDIIVLPTLMLIILGYIWQVKRKKKIDNN